jgi:hypothetical protein
MPWDFERAWSGKKKEKPGCESCKIFVPEGFCTEIPPGIVIVRAVVTSNRKRR